MKTISKHIVWLAAIFLIAAAGSACSDNDDPVVIVPDPDPATLGWVKQETEFGDLPDYLSVYKSPDELDGEKTIAYVAVADMREAKFVTIGDQVYSKTPSKIYAEVDNYPVIMNGGYFSMSDHYSVSLLVKEGELMCANEQSQARLGRTYYTTRGVFRQASSTTGFSVDWAYTTDDGVTYTYSQPSPNKRGYQPQPTPSAYFPVRGEKLDAEWAIGGGPVLLKDGIVRNTYTEELFDADSGIAPESKNPRTAIGVTANNRVIFFVCEGRSVTEGVKGMDLATVAGILKSMGCRDAMNLDGGGSTCMLVNGKQTVKPSGGAQRSITTAVALR
ncbi:MAG: phosphodiester glycosidase family protein [Mediterranea sp.]|jgi:hypothetical protein|nr:phosphodiester glycosidase family protein [Mediterranea sp.]